MAKSSSTQLPGSKDMLKELNNTQGRYVPVWLQPVTSKLKEVIKKTKKSGRTKGNGNKKEKSK
jgi:hypothetical protein